MSSKKCIIKCVISLSFYYIKKILQVFEVLKKQDQSLLKVLRYYRDINLLGVVGIKGF